MQRVTGWSNATPHSSQRYMASTSALPRMGGIGQIRKRPHAESAGLADDVAALWHRVRHFSRAAVHAAFRAQAQLVAWFFGFGVHSKIIPLKITTMLGKGALHLLPPNFKRPFYKANFNAFSFVNIFVKPSCICSGWQKHYNRISRSRRKQCAPNPTSDLPSIRGIIPNGSFPRLL